MLGNSLTQLVGMYVLGILYRDFLESLKTVSISKPSPTFKGF
jgi:hypothetical protein